MALDAHGREQLDGNGDLPRSMDAFVFAVGHDLTVRFGTAEYGLGIALPHPLQWRTCQHVHVPRLGFIDDGAFLATLMISSITVRGTGSGL